jgi:hypothetical protein
VKRGLEQKAKMGIYPAPAPLGYLNDKYAERGNKTIVIDPERFDLVRKMFDTMLTGKYNPKQILEMVNEEWGFRSVNGRKLSQSNIYLIFTRPFYYGDFEYPVGSDKWHHGIHKPMITKEEYDRIQFLLGRRSKIITTGQQFAYRGPIRCGDCGAMVTAEQKIKHQQNGKTHRFVYYHCTRRKDPNCPQMPIEEKELEKQINPILTSMEIPEDFTKWALKRLRTMNEQEVGDREKMYAMQRKEYDGSVKKIDNLIDMRANSEITEDEFRARKTTLLADKERFQKLLKDTDKRVENWLDVAERGFNFAEKAWLAFNKGGLEVRKEIFAALGSDFVLKDRIISIDLDNLLLPVQIASKEAKRISNRLEPHRKAGNTEAVELLYSKNPVMLGGRDSNPDKRLQRALSYR